MIGLLLVAAAIVAVLASLLHRDLRRAEQRRLGGWWYDTWTGRWGRNRAIPFGKCYVFSTEPPPLPPIRLSTDEVLEANRRAIAAELRLSMSIIRPTDYVKIVGTVL